MVGWFVFALLILPVARELEIRRVVDEAPGNTAPFQSQAHDGGVWQTEMAIRRLLQGQNPYGDHYGVAPMVRSFDSAPESWRSIGAPDNPAHHHLTYLPLVVIGTLPFYVVGRTLGFFDPRLVYLACAFLLAWLLGRFVRPGSERRMVQLLVFLNPLLRPYLVAGRNDVLVLVPLVLLALALSERRERAAAFWLGVAIATKQFALFLAPFFLVERWRAFRGDGQRLRTTIAWLAVVPIVTCLPFLLWDARTFVDDTLLWTGRAGASAYPLKWVGWGLSVLAYGIDLVEHPLGANPFGVVGGVAQLFMLIVGIQAVRREPTPTRVLAISAMMLTTMLLFARAYSMSYPVVPFCLIGLAGLMELRARRA